MVRTQVQFTQAQVSRLKAAARAGNVSVAEVVRRCVDGTLSAAPVRRREAFARAARLVGAFRAGTKARLSATHDDHLSDAFR